MRKAILSIIIAGVFIGGILSPIGAQIDSAGQMTLRTNAALAQSTTPPPKEIELEADCGITSWDELSGCIANIAYNIIFFITSKLAHLAANFMDIFIFLSISDASYRHDVVQIGWQLIRDISNIGFMIALIVVAIKIILDMGSSAAKKTITTIIITALLINFSLFFCQVIIDSSNILANIFYRKIEVTNEQPGPDGQKSISVALLSKINPQRLMSKELVGSDLVADQSFWAYATALGAGATVGGASILLSTFTLGGTAALGAGFTASTYYATLNAFPVSYVQQVKGSEIYNYLLVVLMAIILNVVMIYVFCRVAFLFLFRIIGLWIAMIFSPLALLSLSLPFLKKMDYIGFDKWIGTITELSFMAPMFAFFLWLITMFASIEKMVVPDLSANVGIVTKIYWVTFPFLILIVLLIMAQKIVTKMSGEFGKMVNGAMMTAAGVAGGAALGLGGKGFQATFGRAGQALFDSKRLKEAEARGSVTAKMLRSVGKTAGSSSFDVRNAKIGGKGLSDLTGMNLGKGGTGNFEKRRADFEKKRTERAKGLEADKYSDLQRNINKAENKLYDEEQDSTKQAAYNTAKDQHDAKKEIWKRSGAAIGSTEHTDMVAAKANLDATDIALAEKAVKDTKNAKTKFNNKQREEYAKTTRGAWSKATNFVTSGGTATSEAHEVAADEILKGRRPEKT